ncbi:MAG: hypothetical protein GY851_19080 [bacterium]|nr:hypothetical protein [bacterium]
MKPTCIIRGILLSLLIAASPVSNAAASPASIDMDAVYVKGDTWHETLASALTAVARRTDAAEPVPDLGRTDFTLSAWIRTKKDGTIFAKTLPSSNWVRQGKSFFIRERKLCFDIGWVGVMTSDRVVANGSWRHVAVTKRGKRFRFYVDGEQDVSGELDAQADVPGSVAKIGFTSLNFPKMSGFRGDLDELRVYDRALRPSEINVLYETPDSGATEGLAVHWRFEEDVADACAPERVMVVKNLGFAKGKVGKALHLDGSGCVLSGADVGDLVWARTRQDFTDPQSQREMAWEEEDGIWDEAWEPGDWAELATRYAQASHRVADLSSQANGMAEEVSDTAECAAVRSLYLRSRRHAALFAELGLERLESVRRASTFLDTPAHRICVEQLDALEATAAQWKKQSFSEETTEEWRDALGRIERDALLAHNPLMAFDRLIFVRRPTYQSTHYYTDYIDGCVHYGGNVCVLSLEDGTVTDLVPELDGGIFGRYDLSFDATRVVFDYKASPKEGFRLYEVGIDGTGLRQITFPPDDEQARIEKYNNSHLGGTGRIYYHQTDDMHPCYLPDGGICFVSTRCERGILCDSPDILTTTALYKVDKDGGNMTLLSQTPVSEEVPSIMNDGRILYTRWEYVDKGGSAVKCLWAMRPDGTGTVEIFGNDHAFPSFYNGRAVPGHNNLVTCIGGPHMPLGVGTVLRLDINRPIRTRAPMTYLTPEIDIQSEWGYRHRIDGEWKEVKGGPLFDDPFPLSDAFFLVSYNRDKPVHHVSAYDLYLLDEFGNRVCIYDDADMSCWQPMPLRPRRKPPVLPSVLPAPEADETEQWAEVVMSDVYAGLDGATLTAYGEHGPQEGVPRGAVKYIRVMETVARPWKARRFWDGDAHGQQHSVISLWTHTHAKVLHGVVPVEEDGSARFLVPPEKNIFFQALDENYMEIQRMRTFVEFKPGESRSCIGCHEPRAWAPANVPVSAMGRPAVVPMPQPGDTGPRPIHYATDIQPILDRHCVRCHGGEKPKAGMDLSGELTGLFCRSYENLINRGLLKTVGEIKSKMGAVDDTPPYTWGSHASELIAVLRKGHNDTKLSEEEFVRLVTWVDANAPYYGSYFGRKNLKYKDHPQFRPVPTVASASGVAPECVE